MNSYNLNSLWGSLIIEELTRCGVEYFCIAPGSRSTPLTVGVARNPQAKYIICYDERGAAYHAVGYARATQKPAVVITSSGTAAVNLYPAVVEAAEDNLPLIVLTADRPPELHQTQANQTIDQARLYGHYPRWQFNLPCPDEKIGPQMVLTTIDQAVYQSTRHPAGPVHLNCMFREPLEPTESAYPPDYIRPIESWQHSRRPFTVYQKQQLTCYPETINLTADLVNQSRRGLLAVGQLASVAEQAAVLSLINRLNWPVYADISSGLRLSSVGTHLIRHFDQALHSPAFNQWAKPDMVLQLGGRITSKRFPQFLDDVRPPHYVVVKDNPFRADPLHSVTMHLEADLVWFCQHLAEKIAVQSDQAYRQFFQTRAQQAQHIIETHVTSFASISEAYVARAISRYAPDESGLFLSNSMPVRDMDLYGIEGRGRLKIGVNRGVSGIDGIIAAAAGFAAGQKKLTTLLIGDLAFIHDVSSLSLVRSLPAPLVIVVINNRGGGIFHFLPIVKSQDVFEEFFATPHDFSFEGVSRTFGLAYYRADSKEIFDKVYLDALNHQTSAVIEVPTDREENLTLRRAIKYQILELLKV
jgi:2-succinyl-5-enolpyruvyl-6-hydroxy-3-cyclohexene-1-carboxylate synthase